MTDNETALAIPEPAAPLALFGTTDPVQVIEKAARVATALAEVVNKRGLYAVVNGKKFPTVEAWTLCGAMLGVFPITEWVHELHDGKDEVRGFEARVRAQTFGGQVVGAGEARCIRGESKTWHQGAQEFALSSMAQTRATSKALRGPLDFVFKLAGFQPTPAEEMDGIKAVDQDGVITNPSQASVDALRTAQVAQGSPPAAVQPAPPSSGPAPTATESTPAPSVNQGRSVGPRAKRQNVVTAPQAQPAPSVAPGLLDDPLDGKDEYMATLRQQAREVAAQVVYLRVKRGNVRNKDAIALGTMAPVELPPLTPHAGADASLNAFITSQHAEGKLSAGTLEELPEDELTKTVLGTLEEIVKRLEKEGITAP